MLKIKQVYFNVFHSFPVLISFLIPFGYEFNTLIILYGITFFMHPEASPRFSQVMHNKWTYAFFSFFLLNLIACFFSANKKEALVILANSACWIVFPLVLFGKKTDHEAFKKIIFAFVIGCFSVGLFCIIRASVSWMVFGTNEFYYSKFSFFTHPGYLAMYFVFALLIVVLYYKDWFGHTAKIKREIIILSAILITCIFILASKMGILSAVLLLTGTLTMKAFQKYRSFKLILKILAGTLAVTTVLYLIFVPAFKRIDSALKVITHPQNIEKTAHESTAVRILIWRISTEIIEQNLFLGTTPGDANDLLLESYRKNGLSGALKYKLNAHNQFLQTFIGMGLPGFILLLFLTVFLTTYGLVKRLYLLALFEILVILNFMVESMLVRPAGIYFFVFFLCLLLNYEPRHQKNCPDKPVIPV
jgi:O-antigen ligase